MEFKPSKLEDWQIADAARLKALFEDPQHNLLSQEVFGARFDIGNQGMVWQYLNAKRPLNIRAVAAFARGLGVNIADISPTLAQEIDTINENPKLREMFQKSANLDLVGLEQLDQFLDFLLMQQKRNPR